jgi:PST family polysaccharide transporter
MYFEDNKAKAGHGRKSLRGGAITIIARAINAVIQIGSAFFLARLLSPEDYGLVAMVFAITGFAPILVDLGTRDAIVQRERITPDEVSALFWITLLVGCVLSLLVIGSGPLIAHIYHEPRLTVIALCSSVMIIASAMTCMHYALLRRAMMFRSIAIIEVGSNLLGAGIAIGTAFRGLGYWALVLRPIVTSCLLAAAVWFKCHWLPGRPTFTSGVKQMLKFGGNLIAFSVADFVGRNSDRVAIGYGLGASALGSYQNALLVYDNLLDVVVLPLHQVAIAGLSKLQDNLLELKRSWGKALSTVTFYAMPAFGILAVTSQDLVVLFLGAKWAIAGVLLSVLAMRGLPHSVERTLGWLHVAAGRTDRWMRWGVFGTCVQLVALVSGLPFGQMGVVSALTICMYGLFIPAIAYAGRPFGIGAGDVIRVVGRQLLGALFAAWIGFLARQALLPDTERFVRIILTACAYSVVYIILVAGVFKVRTPLVVGLSLIRDFVSHHFAGIWKTRFPSGSKGSLVAGDTNISQ